jgi:hypothetical protein
MLKPEFWKDGGCEPTIEISANLAAGNLCVGTTLRLGLLSGASLSWAVGSNPDTSDLHLPAAVADIVMFL